VVIPPRQHVLDAIDFRDKRVDDDAQNTLYQQLSRRAG